MTVRTVSISSNVVSTLGTGIRSIPALLRDRRRKWLVIGPAIAILAAAAALTYYEAVYRPAHSVTQVPLQTTTVYRGNLTVSAKGTGILQPAEQVQLGFGTNGKLSVLKVQAGEQVTKGQLLAQLDNTQQQVKYEQAQRALANLTSRTSIAQAEQDVATAQTTLANARAALVYLISPAVFDAQEQVLTDQQTLADAQAAGGSSPTTGQQKAIDDAAAKLKADQETLAGSRAWYKEVYAPLNFTVMVSDPTSASPIHRRTKRVEPPSDVEIATAQANYDVAKASLQQAQWYLDALNGRDVPANAGGANLATFQSAQFAAESARATLDGTQIYAPIAGTIISITAKPGDTVGTTPIIVVGDMSRLYLKTYVNEKDYQLFQPGNEADVVFDALPGQTFKGKVIQVDPGLDQSTNTSVVSGLVEMEPTASHLLMGMSASVDVIIGRAQDAVLAPLAALHEYAPGKYAAFVVRHGKLAVDFVQVGLKDQVVAEIKSGLEPGDVVSTGIVGIK